MHAYTPRDCSLHLYIAISLVISKLVSLYMASVQMCSSGGVTDSLLSFAQANGLTTWERVACLVVSVWVFKLKCRWKKGGK